MLVEDDPRVGELIAGLLKKWRQEVTLFGNGEAAWQALGQDAVDLLIVDWKLPLLSGTELVQRIRQDPRLQSLPVLMISGQAAKEDIVGAIKTGINGYLAKPFKPETLKQKIASVLQAHKREAAAKTPEPAVRNTLEDTAVVAEVVAERICQGHIAGEAAQGPLVVLCEKIGSLDDLGQPEHHAALGFLRRADQAIASLNRQVKDLGLHYVVENYNRNLRGRLKRPTLRNRIRLLLLPSAEPYIEEDFILLQHIGIHRKADIRVCLMVGQIQAISQDHINKLQNLGVTVAGRDQLTVTGLETLFEKHILSKVQAYEQSIVLTPKEVYRRIMEALKDAQELPVLPQVYQKIMDLNRNPNSDIQAWIEAIRPDPSSCAMILKRSRAPVYGFTEDIADIDQAIILLGKPVISNLVATEAVRRTFSEVQDKGFSLEGFWLHNLAVACTAHILAFPLNQTAWSAEQQLEFDHFNFDEQALKILKKINLPRRLNLHPTRENPYVGGLVHDIGKVAMVRFCPELYPLVVDHMERHQWNLPMSSAEREVAGGLTHPVVGEILAKQWSLGERLCEAIHYHHQPDISDTFAFLIGIADFLAQAFFPFPQEAEYPIAAALENGDLESVRIFLPEGFFQQPLLSPKELVALANVVGPSVVEYTQDMQAAYW
jgi:HD-like signal output (HDOD) protein/CheY-like chemotaxis protein